MKPNPTPDSVIESNMAKGSKEDIFIKVRDKLDTSELKLELSKPLANLVKKEDHRIK